ncbi:MAG: uridine kinase family protein [Dehalococcoidales bacterium]
MAIDKKGFIFTVMSFDVDYDKVYHQAIKPAITECGYKTIRADDTPGPANAQSEIVRAIIKADYIIAEISEHSPNVFYELGISHCVNNKTIIITTDTKEIPFDLGVSRVIPYSATRDGLRLLKSDLERAIHSLESRNIEIPNNLVQEAGQEYFDLRKKIVDNLKEIEQEKGRIQKLYDYWMLKKNNRKQNNIKVADKIVTNIVNSLSTQNKPLLICLAGSGAIGKSTFAKLIARRLRALHKNKYTVQVLPTDSYQLSRAEREAQNIIGFDEKSHRLDKLRDDVENILRGNTIKIQPYDHTTGKYSSPKKISPSDVLILEGVYSFYPTIIPLCHQHRYYIFANKHQAKELKFIADFTERGYDIQQAFRHADEEYNAYENHILPYLKLADWVIVVDEYWKYKDPVPPE